MYHALRERLRKAPVVADVDREGDQYRLRVKGNELQFLAEGEGKVTCDLLFVNAGAHLCQ